MRFGRMALVALATAGGLVLPDLTAPPLTGLGSAEPTAPALPGTAAAPLPVLTPASLNRRYAQSRQAITKSAATARAADDRTTAARLDALAAPGRAFLAFGEREAVEVVGDLTTARRIAVLVPGADTTPATFESRGTASPGGGARAVLAETRRLDPGSRTAVIAWLGYDPPRTLSPDIATARRADRGAPALRRLVTWLNRPRAGREPARISLLCHSYGSVVCARAAANLPVSDIAVFGSPGMTVSSTAGLHTRARVWAGRAAGDWTAYVPDVRLFGIGFGADPTSRRFGALRFATGGGGHSDYLEPGGVSLRNLALIVLGRAGEVVR